MFTQGEWREYTDEDGDHWVLAGKGTMPGDMHSYYIGDLEDACGECHGNANLMVNAPRLYNALKHIIEYANTCNTMTPAAGYRRIIKLAEHAIRALEMPSEEDTFKLDLSLPEAAE